MHEGWAEGAAEDGDVGLCIARHACGPHSISHAPDLRQAVRRASLPFIGRRPRLSRTQEPLSS